MIGKSASFWTDAYERIKSNRLALFSLVVILLYVLLGATAQWGWICREYAQTSDIDVFLGPSWEHPFGTDMFGRDILQRGIYAAGTALSVGLVSSSLALIIGLVLGALAGYFGGKVDAFVVWIYTTIDSIPYILLVPALAFILGRGLSTVFIAVGLTSWVTLCRLVRAEFIKQKQREYVQAAESLGASHMRRIFIHILPNVLHLGFVQFGLGFVSAIKIEVILSYLGLGVEVGRPSWGMMLDDAKGEIGRGFLGNLTAATILMFGLILSFNFFVDALRDALDPKLKNAKGS